MGEVGRINQTSESQVFVTEHEVIKNANAPNYKILKKIIKSFIFSSSPSPSSRDETDIPHLQGGKQRDRRFFNE